MNQGPNAPAAAELHPELFRGAAPTARHSLEAWAAGTSEGRAILQLTTPENLTIAFEMNPAIARDLSNRILAAAARAQLFAQGGASADAAEDADS